MKLVKKSRAELHRNSASCTAFEYPLNDKDLNGAVIILQGRYPDHGYAKNTVCKEMAYIIHGSGTLTVDANVKDIAKGDVVLIEPNEQYYFMGDLEMFMPCAPAWYPEQHQAVE